MATTDDLLEEITDLGWYVYAIYQTPPRWDVYLRHPAELISHASAADLFTAMSIAIDRIPEAQPHSTQPAIYSIQPTLAEILGLPAKVKIKRRF